MGTHVLQQFKLGKVRLYKLVSVFSTKNHCWQFFCISYSLIWIQLLRELFCPVYIRVRKLNIVIMILLISSDFNNNFVNFKLEKKSGSFYTLN